MTPGVPSSQTTSFTKSSPNPGSEIKRKNTMIQDRLLGELGFLEVDHGWALDLGLKLGLAGCVNASQSVPSKVSHRLAAVDFKRLSSEVKEQLTEHGLSSPLPEGLCDPNSWARLFEDLLKTVEKNISSMHRAFIMVGFACSCLTHAQRADTMSPEYARHVAGMAWAEVARLQSLYPAPLAKSFDTDAVVTALLPAAMHKYPEQALRSLFAEWRLPITVLLVQSDPVDKTRLRHSEHHQQMSETLASSLHRTSFEMQVIANVRPELLGPKIAGFRPTIVHFSGHSTAQGVVMSDSVGKAVDINPEQLAKLLVLARKDRLRGVVMNACYTADQLLNEKEKAAGLGEVVVMEGQLADDAAIRFSQQFYAYLGTGLSFGQSFHWASVSADLVDSGGRLQPKLLNL